MKQNRIDCHSHVFPESFLELLESNPGSLRARREGKHWIVTYGETQDFHIDPGRYSVETKLREMNAGGICHSLLSPNIPGPDLLEGEVAVRGSQALNDALAAIGAEHPGSFSALITLPWSRPAAALEELERAAALPGFRGVVLHSHIAGRPVDSPEFEPLYRAIAERGLPLVLHPTVPTWGDAVRDHQMIPMMGLQVDCSFALLRLVLSGVLERNPSLRVVMPHAGGVLPYMMGRIEHQTEVMGRGRERISKAPASYFRQVYLDSVTPSVETLAFAHRFAGPDRVLFGSDHPWVEVPLMNEVADRLELTLAEHGALAAENARELFGIPREIAAHDEELTAASTAASPGGPS